jgi:hypothetical protein
VTQTFPGATTEPLDLSPPPTSAMPAVRRKVAFITGCGRSGTTILGTILSKHEHVHYMNDQFELWTRPFPKTDIWGYASGIPSNLPRVELTAEDADSPQGVRRFREVVNAVKAEKPVLVEKVAINNFRIGFLLALVPEAYLVNIVRHGVEVAFSIAAKADAGLWYGVNDRKWELLVEHAVLRGCGHLLKHVKTSYDRGLLEWRMSVECAERYLASNPPARLLRLRYEELIADSGGVVDRVTEFLGVAPSQAMRRFAVEGVERKNPAAGQREAPASTEAIAGETLRRLGYWF